MSVANVLNRAADLIEPEGAWTQGYVARSRAGEIVEPEERAASCWCGIGAVIKVARCEPLQAAACQELHRVASDRGFPSFGQFNDAPERTQAEVVAALRAAAIKAGT